MSFTVQVVFVSQHLFFFPPVWLPRSSDCFRWPQSNCFLMFFAFVYPLTTEWLGCGSACWNFSSMSFNKCLPGWLMSTPMLRWEETQVCSKSLEISGRSVSWCFQWLPKYLSHHLFSVCKRNRDETSKKGPGGQWTLKEFLKGDERSKTKGNSSRWGGQKVVCESCSLECAGEHVHSVNRAAAKMDDDCVNEATKANGNSPHFNWLAGWKWVTPS